MRIGQNCTRLKTLSKLILLATIFNCATYPVYPQAENNQSSQKSFQPKNPSQPCWVLPNENFEADKVASDNESIFLSTMDGRLISVNSKTGLKNWDTNFGGQLKTSIKVSESENAVFIASNREPDKNLIETGNNAESEDNLLRYTIRRLDKETGVAVWQIAIPIKRGSDKILNSDESDGTNRDDIYLYSASSKLIVGTRSGEFYLLDSRNGKMQTHTSFLKGISTVPSLTDGQFIVFGSDQQIYVLSIMDLSEVAKFDIKRKTTTILKSGETIVSGDERGIVNLRLFPNGSSFKKVNEWKLRTGGEILSIKSVQKSLIIASLDNYIYSVSVNDGKLLWKKRLPNRPAFEPLVVNDYAVLTSVGDSSVLFVELNTGKTINKINPGENFSYTGAPQIVGSMIILSTNNGLSAYTSEKTCGG